MHQLFLFFICICATTLGAISGIGGGVIIKPVLDATSGMGVSAISFLSGCTVLTMTVVSLLRSRGGEVKIEAKRGTLLAIGGAAGGIAGKWLFDFLKAAFGNDAVVGTAQSVMMVILTLGVLAYVLNKQRIRSLQVRSGVACVAIGLGLGILSAFLGIGGGPINLAVLYYFFSMDSKTAALNSLYVILFSQSASFLSTVLQGKVPEFSVPALVVMMIGGVAGGFLGRSVSKRMDNRKVDVLFRWMLVLITAISVYNLIRYASAI